MVSLTRGCSIVGVLAALAGVPGCAEDLAGDQAGADTDGDTGQAETGDEGPATTDPTDPGGSTGTPDPADSSDTDGATAGGGTTGEDSEDFTPDSGCEDLDCGGAGLCEVGDEGPVCVCDDGYASIGLDCLPCEPISAGMLPADVPAVRAQFTFLLDSEDAPDSGLSYGRVKLRNRASGDVVPLGLTNAQAAVFMVPGVYDVLYEHREGSDFPRNSSAVLERIEVGDDADFKIDIVPIVMRGAIGFAPGSEPATPGLNYGRVWLVNPTTDDRVLLGTTQDDVYDVKVLPGEYEVHYEYQETQGDAPLNNDGFVMDLSILDPGDTERNIIIPVAQVSGAVTVDDDFVASGIDYGELELRDVHTGDRFHLGYTNSPDDYSVTVIPGTYEVVYSSRELGTLTPVNRNTVVDLIQVTEGSNDIQINLRTSEVSGEFTLGGETPPTEDYDDGLVTLERADGDPVVLGNTRSGFYNRRVLAGSYDVFYGQDTASQSMPVNTHARLGKPVLIDTRTRDLDIDIGVVEVLGTMTIGGVEAPDSAYDDGRVFLRNAESGDSVLLGNTREGSYAARLVPGTYDIVYANEFSDTILPVNQGAVLVSGVLVSADETLDVDVPVTTLIGSVAIEGSTPKTAEGVGNLFLRDVATDDQVFISDTNAAEFSKPLTSGTYLMEYRGTAAAGAALGTSLPANSNAAFACFELTSD